MANLPQIIPGGRIDPTASGVPADISIRLKKREEEAEILRIENDAKQEKLRKGLKTWDKLQRESASMGLRSELSERHVRMLAGEGVGGAAF
jgi:amino acid permease